MKRPVVLVAGGDGALRQRLKGLLGRHRYEVMESSGDADALRSAHALSPDLIVIGSAPDDAGAGLGLVEQIRRRDRQTPLLLMPATSSEERVIAAMRATGGFTAGLVNGQRMIGESRAMQDLKAYVASVASTDTNVLITGETGTGKELTAELVHRNSARSQRPMVSINCAAIPDSLLESELFGYERGAFTGAGAFQEGKLKLADRGSAFFDEIADMSLTGQAKILRVIENKELHRLGGRGSVPLNVRVIAATNQDLEQCVADGRFRKDLYFRLNVARIHLPPLRERKEDIPSFLEHYVGELNHQHGRDVEGFTADALDGLLRHDWPGNVRELRNLVEAIFVGPPPRRISFVDLPAQFRRRLGDAGTLPPGERERVLSALFTCQWNKSQAARELHWSRMTLYRKMAKYHLGRAAAATPELSERRS